MDEAFLSYYNRELDFVRKLGAEFAEQHPKIAGRLRLDKETVEDPHVSRLIESFAFLTARVRQTIDDSFPELTEALMGVLYPEFHAPYPSMSIAQIRVIKENPVPQTVVANTDFLVEGDQAGDCVFKTCSDIDILPLSIEKARVANAPAKAPKLELTGGAKKHVKSVLSITIKPFSSAKLSEFRFDKIRFFIDAQPQLAFKILDQLLSGTIGIAVASSAGDTNPTCLTAEHIIASGLKRDENTYGDKFDGRNSGIQKKIIDYFVFPKRFLFFDVCGLRSIWEQYQEGFTLYFYWENSDPELIQGVDESTFKLGCVPVVNLFEDTIDYIEAQASINETKMEVNRSYVSHADVHHIKRVYAKGDKGETVELQPFYGVHRKAQGDDGHIYWNLRRENSRLDGGRVSPGTDAYLSFVDSKFRVFTPESRWLIGADVICNNRDLPAKLPFGPDAPKISFRQGGASLRVKFICPASSTIPPQLHSATRWQLIAHLTLQSFCGEDGVRVLKETLRLYDLANTRETQALIDGVKGISTSTVTSRITQQGRAAICQGTEINITFDDSQYSGSSYILLGCILDEFFSQLCAINTFTQLNIRTSHQIGTCIQCPPRVGSQALV